jgi:hypothetical protein
MKSRRRILLPRPDPILRQEPCHTAVACCVAHHSKSWPVMAESGRNPPPLQHSDVSLLRVRTWSTRGVSVRQAVPFCLVRCSIIVLRGGSPVGSCRLSSICRVGPTLACGAAPSDNFGITTPPALLCMGLFFIKMKKGSLRLTLAVTQGRGSGRAVSHAGCSARMRDGDSRSRGGKRPTPASPPAPRAGPSTCCRAFPSSSHRRRKAWRGTAPGRSR